MQRFQFPHRGKFDASDWPRFMSQLKDAVEKWEFDSGWKATPADKTVKHGMQNVPGFVQVQESDDKRGANFSVINASSVTSKNVVFSTATKAYIRVIASY